MTMTARQERHRRPVAAESLAGIQHLAPWRQLELTVFAYGMYQEGLRTAYDSLGQITLERYQRLMEDAEQILVDTARHITHSPPGQNDPRLLNSQA